MVYFCDVKQLMVFPKRRSGGETGVSIPSKGFPIGYSRFILV